MDFSSFGLVWRCEGASMVGAEHMLSVSPAGQHLPVVRVGAGTGLPASTPLLPGLSGVVAGGCVLGVPGVARFDIKRESVWIQALEHADPKEVQLFLWGSAAGAVLHLNGLLPLHGSTVRLPDGTAAVFCGHSGAGKSTTVAALGQRGLACVTDDVSVISFDAQGLPWVYPGLPRVKLWAEALSLLDLPKGQQIREGMNKYYVDIPVCQEPLRLTRFYELDVVQGEDVLASPIEGVGRMTALLNHTYRLQFVGELGLRAAHMAQVARLAPLLKMGRICRPHARSTLTDLVDLVLQDCV